MKRNCFFSANETPAESNTLIYTYVKNTYEFYKIIGTYQHHVTCYKQGRFPVSFNETPKLQWDKVGVFKLGSLSKEKVDLKYSEISGKVLLVNGIFLTCPKNVLQEQ